MTLSEGRDYRRTFYRNAEHAVIFGGLSEAYVPLKAEDVVNIYRMCM